MIRTLHKFNAILVFAAVIISSCQQSPNKNDMPGIVISKDDIAEAKAEEITSKDQLYGVWKISKIENIYTCLLYTSPSPRDQRGSRMPSSA